MQNLYTVYDEAAGAFLPPFFVPAHGLALRAFKDCVNSADHMFGKHPDHYTLFHLGEWDDVTCEFDLITRKPLGNGVEFKNIELPTDIKDHLNEQAPIDPNQ